MFSILHIWEILNFLPECFLALAQLIIFTWRLRYSNSIWNNHTQISKYRMQVILMSLIITWLCLNMQLEITLSLFYNTVIITPFIQKSKQLILMMACFYFFIIQRKHNKTKLQFEISFLIMTAIWGMLLLVGANDWILVYLAIELQSLSSYILATHQTKSLFSTEARTKYFILGSFASRFLLFGISLIYRCTGTTQFDCITQLLLPIDSLTPTLQLGILMIWIALFFKMGIAPFHRWLPDVYERSPLKITFFFALLPKIAFFSFSIRLLSRSLLFLWEFWQPMFILVTLFTLTIRTFRAVIQTKIKRFLAYTTMVHTAYMLMALSTRTIEGYQAVYLYIIVYAFTILRFFSFLFMLEFKNEQKIQYLNDLIIMQSHHPIFSYGFSLLLLSSAGIPFLARFYTKFFIFSIMWEYQFYYLTILSLTLTLLSTFYYIRIIKILFFEPQNCYFVKKITWNDQLIPIFVFSIFFIFLFSMLSAPIFTITADIAHALF